MQQERFRNVEREELYLQTFHRNIHIGSTCRDVAVAWRKIILEKQDSLFVKTRSRLWKTSRLAGKGKFFNGKDNLNEFSCKYPVLVKQDKFLHIISL